MDRNIRTIIISILMVALFFGMTPFCYADNDDVEIEEALDSYDMGSKIRVGLVYGTSAQASYTLTSDDGFYIGSLDGTVFTPETRIDSNKVIAYFNQGYVCLSLEDGTVISYDFKGKYLSSADWTKSKIKYGSSYYREYMSFTTNSASLNLINTLTLDHYVYGVVNSELSHGNPLEALKAQAVCARSYAKYVGAKHASYGFDVCSTTNCQVYKGVSNEYADCIQAVDETSGEFIYYNGKAVCAYYSANSGGYTQSAEDVWGSPQGYLQAVEDKYSPDYNWTATMTFSDIAAKMNAAGLSVGEVTRVEIVKRNISGAVDTLAVTGTAGTKTLTKEKVRTVLGGTAIKCTIFSFEGSAPSAGSLQPVNNGDIFAIGLNTGAKKLGSSVVAVGRDGVKRTISLDGAVVIGANGKTTLSASDDDFIDVGAKPVTGLTDVATESPVKFVGKGNGHGVGLSQQGAAAMAKQGFTYDEILKFYYTDIQIRS